MIIGIPKETHPGEQRVAFIPSSVDRLVKKGAQVTIEAGLGASIGISDEEYKKRLQFSINEEKENLKQLYILKNRPPSKMMDAQIINKSQGSDRDEDRS